MKKCPHAKWDPLSSTQTQPAMSAHRVVCLHTMVGYLASTRTMFKQNGYSGTESHYGVGGKWGSDPSRGYDGYAFQWQDRRDTPDANLEGNPHVISIETADNAPAAAKDIQPWTPKQVETLVDIIAWECSHAAHSECPSDWTCRKGVQWEGLTVAIPPVLIPDTQPGRRGIGYHRQGVDPWRESGAEAWSTSYGKECPGPVRIAQLKSEIIPKVQAKLKGEDMPITKEDAELIADTILKRDKIAAPNREPNPVDNPTWQLQSFAKAILNEVDDTSVKVAGIATDVNDTLAQSEANRDALHELAQQLASLNIDAARGALLAAGEVAAQRVTEAGEALLAKLDAIRLDINRG